jgi:cytochrome c peroxidase
VLAADAPRAKLPPALSEADFLQFDQSQIALGQLLFYDKILSGNRNISCGTCHHHTLGSADGLSLGVGEGGAGLGPIRTTGAGSDEVHERVPRNAPALWNLAHKDITAVFHDGRLAVSDSHPSGFQGPAGDEMLHGLNSLIAAQALFPPTSATEMAGQGNENDVAIATAKGMHNVWPILAARVAEIPEYQQLFTAAFDHVAAPEDITYVEIANAIAAFVGTEFRNFDSPFDQHLAGDTGAMSDQQKRGMQLFFGEAGCSGCHAGPLLWDQSFHALGLPHFGPGRTAWYDPVPRDVGRMAITGDLTDAYMFKTPFLRNVALTAPYGHNGAMPTLEAMVRHHLNPAASLAAYKTEMAALRPADWLAERDLAVLGDAAEDARIIAALDIALPQADEAQVADIVAFLHALTGDTAQTRPMGVPERVPSGLPVD